VLPAEVFAADPVGVGSGACFSPRNSPHMVDISRG
jgi:hypothetical protein